MCIKIELEIGVWIFEEDKKTENSKETFELGLDPNPTHLWHLVKDSSPGHIGGR